MKGVCERRRGRAARLIGSATSTRDPAADLLHKQEDVKICSTYNFPPRPAPPQGEEGEFDSGQALLEEVERGDREGAHIVDAVALAGLDGDRALAIGSDHGDAGMPGGMAVAAAGRPGC